MIIIIDDGSNPELIDDVPVDPPCMVVSSAFPKRGELLPYYYYYHNFMDAYDYCVVLHDSVFLQRPFLMTSSMAPVQFLWHFDSCCREDIETEIKMLGKLNHAEALLETYHGKYPWKGCFGVMSVISGALLKLIVDKYNWFVLMDDVQSRKDRSCLERVFAILCVTEWPELCHEASLFGDIMDPRWRFGYQYNTCGGRSFAEYLELKHRQCFALTMDATLPIVKVWTGR